MYWDENGRIHNDEEEPQFGSLKNKALVNLINLGSAIRETNTKSEAYKNKTNAILGALTLLSGGIPSVTRYGASKLSPILGRKLGETIASGTSSGMVAGGVEGFGRGIIEERNPLETMALDAVIGALGGGAVSGAYGRGGQAFRGSRLKQHKKIENMRFEERKKFRNLARSYYDDYIKGTYVKREDLGRIKFGNIGIDEQVSKGLHNVDVLPVLKKQIKEGKYIEQRKDYPRDDIQTFYIIENDLKDKKFEYQIAKDINGNKYYFAKDISGERLYPTYRNQHPGSDKASNNSIANQVGNFNPVQNKTSQKLRDFARVIEIIRKNRRR